MGAEMAKQKKTLTDQFHALLQDAYSGETHLALAEAGINQKAKE